MSEIINQKELDLKIEEEKTKQKAYDLKIEEEKTKQKELDCKPKITLKKKRDEEDNPEKKTKKNKTKLSLEELTNDLSNMSYKEVAKKNGISEKKLKEFIHFQTFFEYNLKYEPDRNRPEGYLITIDILYEMYCNALRIKYGDLSILASLKKKPIASWTEEDVMSSLTKLYPNIAKKYAPKLINLNGSVLEALSQCEYRERIKNIVGNDSCAFESLVYFRDRVVTLATSAQQLDKLDNDYKLTIKRLETLLNDKFSDQPPGSVYNNLTLNWSLGAEDHFKIFDRENIHWKEYNPIRSLFYDRNDSYNMIYNKYKHWYKNFYNTERYIKSKQELNKFLNNHYKKKGFKLEPYIEGMVCNKDELYELDELDELDEL